MSVLGAPLMRLVRLALCSVNLLLSTCAATQRMKPEKTACINASRRLSKIHDLFLDLVPLGLRPWLSLASSLSDPGFTTALRMMHRRLSRPRDGGSLCASRSIIIRLLRLTGGATQGRGKEPPPMRGGGLANVSSFLDVCRRIHWGMTRSL